MSSENLERCKRLHFSPFCDGIRGGALTPIEGEKDVPFKIARVFDIRNVPKAGFRGGHSHQAAQQVVRAIAGSFWLIATTEAYFEFYFLSDPDSAVYVPPGIRVDLVGFSEDAVCQVYSDRLHEEEDCVK